jgi:hypothetical protein
VGSVSRLLEMRQNWTNVTLCAFWAVVQATNATSLTRLIFGASGVGTVPPCLTSFLPPEADVVLRGTAIPALIDLLLQLVSTPVLVENRGAVCMQESQWYCRGGAQ